MGTWGTGLFADDMARDVRDAYRDHIGDGLSGPAATDALLHEYTGQLDDSDGGPVFWLALAATQWRLGRLEDRVKAKALTIITSRADLRRWQDDPRGLKRREAVLVKLAEQLQSPQPTAKRVAKPFRNSTDWEVGEIVTYRLTSGNLAIFRVIGSHSDRGGTAPVAELLDWRAPDAPSPAELKRLGLMPRIHERAPGSRNQVLLGRVSAREFPADRVVRTGVKLEPSQPAGGFTVLLWKHMDMLLERLFGIA